MQYTYLLINLFSVSIPLLFSFHPKIRFDRNFKAFILADLIAAFFFIVWDILFTRKEVWGFNDEYLTGAYLLNLPLEEVLFFICIPFACLFTYHSLKKFYNINWRQDIRDAFTLILVCGLLIFGLVNIEKVYTFVTFTSASLLLFFLGFVIKAKWLSSFYSSYFILLIPFFIVNGLLTGTGLEDPVVWYNNAETLGIRLFTIPVEDIFFGMELLLLTTFFYEEFSYMFGLNTAGMISSIHHE